MKKEMVMKRAWKIAKDAHKKFGGKVTQYLSGALKLAWAEIKDLEKVVTLDQIKIALAENGRFTVNEWKKYGKHRLYITSYTGGGWKRDTSFFEIVGGKIVGKSSSMIDYARDVFYKYEGYRLA
ncbi:hypothetical protein J9303_00830 [Bacillaceae bacterium Marseille-Q3522]|nr:hypothetical protein [Bacillaceae bacterium Marseille-Q3522]